MPVYCSTVTRFLWYTFDDESLLEILGCEFFRRISRVFITAYTFFSSWKSWKPVRILSYSRLENFAKSIESIILL